MINERYKKSFIMLDNLDSLDYILVNYMKEIHMDLHHNLQVEIDKLELVLLEEED